MKEVGLDFLRRYVAAIQLYTRVPVTGSLASPAAMRPEAGSRHLPGVGWLVGALACITFALLAVLLQGSEFVPFAAAVGSTIATMLLTGMRHESGLARWFDRPGPGHSQPGARGAAALMMALLAKVALLAVLGGQSAAGVLVAIFAGHTMSRLAPLLVVQRLALVEENDNREPLVARLGKREWWVAAAWCAPPLLLAMLAVGPGFAVFAMLAAASAWWGMLRLYGRTFNGHTAECLHASQQACEIAFYLGAAVGWALS